MTDNKKDDHIVPTGEQNGKYLHFFSNFKF
jgi:hypothetical protein